MAYDSPYGSDNAGGGGRIGGSANGGDAAGLDCRLHGALRLAPDFAGRDPAGCGPAWEPDARDRPHAGGGRRLMDHLSYLLAAYSVIFTAIFFYLVFIWRRQSR